MTNYDHCKYMPGNNEPATENSDNPSVEQADTDSSIKADAALDRNEDDERQPMQPLDLSTEQIIPNDKTPSKAMSDPERNALPDISLAPDGWAYYLSLIFSPLMGVTYCTLLAMWITPLANVSENTRAVTSTVVLLLTAGAPMISILTMGRLGIMRHFDTMTRRQRLVPAAVAFVGTILSAFYMNHVRAPYYLEMIYVVAAADMLIFFGLNFFTLVSGHALCMGAITAYVYYLGINNLATVTITPWVMALVLLSGFVASARLKRGNHTIIDVALGFFVGTVATYALLQIPLFR